MTHDLNEKMPNKAFKGLHKLGLYNPFWQVAVGDYLIFKTQKRDESPKKSLVHASPIFSIPPSAQPRELDIYDF